MLPPILQDPVPVHVAAAAIATVLGLGAWQKLRDIEVFEHALAAYELLPRRWLPAAARLLPFAELLAAALLLPTATRLVGAGLAILLLLIVTLAVVRNLHAGRSDIECGCGGQDGMTLSWALVLRNALLIGVAMLAALPPTPRLTTTFDIATGVFATLALLSLYTVGNQLIANEPRLKKLRNAP